MKLSVFSWVPPIVQGYQRDIRAQWAFHEAGLPFEIEQFSMKEIKTTDYRQWQPFGQIPALKDGDQKMFESGAILIHIAERAASQANVDLWGGEGREKAIMWVTAGLSSIEPFLYTQLELDLFHKGEPWVEMKRPATEKLVAMRLGELNTVLNGREFLTAKFGIADILMAEILRQVDRFGVLDKHTHVKKYLERCSSRDAFKKSYETQMRIYRENEPKQ